MCVYKYKEIQKPRFQRNYITARDQKTYLHGTSFQSSPKISCMLTCKTHLHTTKVYNTRSSQFCLKDSYFFFDHSVVLTCSKIIDAFFAKHAWLQSRNDSWSRIPWSPQRTPGTMTPKLCTKYDEKAPPLPSPLPGVLPEKLGGVCGTLSETLTLSQTKICGFPYPISDLTPLSQARDRSECQAVTAHIRLA